MKLDLYNIIKHNIKLPTKMDFNKEFLAADALENTKYEFSTGLGNILRAGYGVMKNINDLFIRYVFDALMFSKNDKFNIRNFKISYVDVENLAKQNNLRIPSRQELIKLEDILIRKYLNYISREKFYSVKRVIRNNLITYDIYPQNRNIRMMRFRSERFDEIASKYVGKAEYFDKMMALMIMRYSILGTENQHLSFPPSIMKKLGVDIELFGTPLNTSSPRFCSPFPDVERYFGSLGNFFNFNLISNKTYTFDPPYVEELMDDATERLLSQLDNINNFLIIVNIPVWDSVSQKKYNFRDYHMRFRTYEMLSTSKYLHSETVAFKFENKYYNYFSNTYIPVSNTHLMILTDREINFNAEDLKDMWKDISYL